MMPPSKTERILKDLPVINIHDRRTMRILMPTIILTFFVCISLSACGIVPLWVSVATTAGDFILADQTGKSSGEHGLSAITGKDCQFIRFIDSAKVCMSAEEYGEYLLSLNCEAYTWNRMGRVSCGK